MINKLKKRQTRFRWGTSRPTDDSKLALIIPHYNESSNIENFFSRLDYFDFFAQKYRNYLDVILVDDGSADESLRLIEHYHLSKSAEFYVASVYPNAQKVGAIYLTVESVRTKYVILSDFDTDILGLENIFYYFSKISEDKSIMGGYFRMLPFSGNGLLFLYQQLEYSILRGLYRFHESDHSVAVIPGAGGCFDRDILLKIYSSHSGLLNGEDRESTLLGLKLGMKVLYFENVLALTRPPLTFKTLIKQRVRWNLGYIETFAKERVFYFRQFRAFKKFGFRFVSDWLWILCILIAFPAFGILGIFNICFMVKFSLCWYLLGVIWCLFFWALSPNETTEFKKRRLLSIFLFPVFKPFIDFVSWSGAFIAFYKK